MKVEFYFTFINKFFKVRQLHRLELKMHQIIKNYNNSALAWTMGVLE